MTDFQSPQPAHTPGPWSRPSNDPQFVYALNPQGYNQFWFRVHGAHTATAELEANARLIAAAPELLAALQMVQEEAIDKRGGDFNLTNEQWATFHAAIARATGAQA